MFKYKNSQQLKVNIDVRTYIRLSVYLSLSGDYHNNTMMPIQPLHYNSRVMRHFENSSWAWQEIFVKYVLTVNCRSFYACVK